MKKRTNIIAGIHNRRVKQGRRTREFSFDASPMGDIAFLLLIFFIVTGSFILRQGLFFTMPAKSSGVQRVELDSIMEIFPQENGYLYKEKQYTGKQLSDEMKTRYRENGELIVLLRIAKDLPYERLTQSLSIVRDTGVKYVSVKDKAEPEPEAE